MRLVPAKKITIEPVLAFEQRHPIDAFEPRKLLARSTRYVKERWKMFMLVTEVDIRLICVPLVRKRQLDFVQNRFGLVISYVGHTNFKLKAVASRQIGQVHRCGLLLNLLREYRCVAVALFDRLPIRPVVDFCTIVGVHSYTHLKCFHPWPGVGEVVRCLGGQLELPFGKHDFSRCQRYEKVEQVMFRCVRRDLNCALQRMLRNLATPRLRQIVCIFFWKTVLSHKFQ